MHRQSLRRCTLLLILAACTSDAAASGGHGHGHGHGHGSVGFYFNDPYWWGPDPFFYQPYRPYIYNSPPIIVERDPPVYIQRQPAPAPAPTTTWYYCQNPAGYYPYVQSCGQPWLSVDPRSVPAAR